MSVDEAKRRQVFKEIMLLVAPDELAMVRGNVERIIDDVEAGKTTRYSEIAGRPNDWLEATKILVEVATFTKTVLEIYFMVAVHTKKPSQTDIQKALPAKSNSLSQSEETSVIGKVREMLD